MKQAERNFRAFQRSGDPRALGRVFDLTAAVIWRLAVHLSRDSHEAEDLVQNTFLTAIEKAASWDPKRPLLPWLLGILSMLAREARRRSGRDLDPERLRQPRFANPEEDAARHELEEAIWTALCQIPEPYRETLTQHLVQDLSASEIAKSSGMRQGTVRMRIHRGLSQLKAHLPRGLSTAGVPLVMSSTLQASLRTKILSPLPGSTVAAAAGTGIVLPILGVLAMKKIVLASMAAAAVLLSSWWLYSPEVAEEVDTQVAETPNLMRVPVPDARPDAEPSAESESEPATERKRIEVTKAQRTWLTGRIAWKGGNPVIEARVEVDGEWASRDTFTTNTNGVFKIPVLSLDDNHQEIPRRLALRVTPRCWLSPWEGEVKITRTSASFRAERIDLPNEVDVEFSLDINKDLLEILASHGIKAFSVGLFEPQVSVAFFIRKQLGEVHLPLDDLGSPKSLRIPYKATVATHLFMQTSPGKTAVPSKTLIHLVRDRINSIQLSLDRSQFLRVQVVDHLGNPLPYVGLNFQLKMPSLARGYANNMRMTSRKGDLLYIGAAWTTFRIQAYYCGLVQTVDRISPSLGSIRIEIDLSDRVRLALKNKDKAIKAYKISPATPLFGSSEPPSLPFHKKGLRFLPMNVGDEPKWLVLTWKQGDRFREVVHLFTPDKEQIVLDVDTLEDEKLGSFEILFGQRSDCLIKLERIAPAPPTRVTRYWRSVIPTKGQTRAMVAGAPPGRYRIRIGKIRAFPNTPPLAELTREINGQKASIDIEAILSGK